MYESQEERKGYLMCIVGELASHLSSLQRESPREGSALCVSKRFPDRSVLCPLCPDLAHTPLFSVFLQMDQQLRLSYNFSPEVEFRVVRSLTLGKVTGLYSSPEGFVKIKECISDFHQVISRFRAGVSCSHNIPNLAPRFLV